jgi:hypothetical protein
MSFIRSHEVLREYEFLIVLDLDEVSCRPIEPVDRQRATDYVEQTSH